MYTTSKSYCKRQLLVLCFLEQLEKENDKVEKVKKILLCCADASKIQKVNGEVVEIKVPSGLMKFEITKISI